MQKLFYIAVLVFAALTSGARTVAISYFDNTSGDIKYNALSKGIADMLITDLSKVQGITIVEREKLEKLIGEIKLGQSKYFDQNTAQKLGKGLGAQTILTGAYFILGNEIRIDARLLDVESGGVIAAEEVTGNKSNFFGLHKQLAGLLSKSLKFSYNPDKSEFLQNTDAVELTAVVNYSNAIDYQDNGLGEEAELLLEKTTTEFPDFVFAKNKLEQIKENLKKLEEQREAALAEQLKNTLENLDNNSANFGADIMNVWTGLMTSFKYSQLLVFNSKLRKMDIDPARKLYGETSPLTFGEMIDYYDFTAYSMLKKHDAVIELGQQFLNKYPSSMYFTSVKMNIEQAIQELEARKAGKEKVGKLLQIETFDAYVNFINQLEWETNQKLLSEQGYKRFKRLYKAQVLSAPKQVVMAWDESMKLDEATAFFEVAQYFNDTKMMEEIAAFAVQTFEGTDDEIDAYDLENDLADYKADYQKIADKQQKIEAAIASNKRDEMEKIVDWLFTYREVKRPDLKIKICEQYIKDHPPGSEKEREVTLEAWEYLITELAEVGKLDEAQKKLEQLKQRAEEYKFNQTEFNKVYRELRVDMKQAEKEYKEFKENIGDYDPMQAVLTKHAEAYRDSHLYIDEITTRKELINRYPQEEEQQALQMYMLVMAYYNSGNFDNARETAKELQEKFPTNDYTQTITTFMNTMPQ